MQSILFKSLIIMIMIYACYFDAAASLAQGVRVEVSDRMTYGRVTGWERDLTERDPNLSHWHWEPIGTSAHIRSEKRFADQTKPQPTVPQYVKTVYVKPIHVAFPGGAQTGGTGCSAADLNGRLLKHSPASVIAQTPHIDSYSDYTSGGTVSSYESSANTKVVGKVVSIYRAKSKSSGLHL